MIASSDLASSKSFLALSGFMLNSLATCSTLFSSIIWHLYFWPQHRYVQIAKISSAYLPYRTVKYAVVNVIVFTVNSNRVHRLSGFPVRCLSLLGLCHLFHLYPCLRRLMPRRSRQKAPISTPIPIAASIIFSPPSSGTPCSGSYCCTGCPLSLIASDRSGERIRSALPPCRYCVYRFYIFLP